MKKHDTGAAERPLPKHPVRKTKAQSLSICPVNGAGWCPYPFSPAQLLKHLKAKAQQSKQLAKAGSS